MTTALILGQDVNLSLELGVRRDRPGLREHLPSLDIVLLDPNMQKTLTMYDLHADSDYNIWEGFACQGYPVMTMLRGKVIVENGQLVGSSTDGRWLKRRVSGDVISRPVV